jgi:hypothetical protein
VAHVLADGEGMLVGPLRFEFRADGGAITIRVGLRRPAATRAP